MAFMIPISRLRSRIAITSVFTIPMQATASARLPKIPRNRSTILKNVCRPLLASSMEKVLKPIFLIACSTESTLPALLTRAIMVEYVASSLFATLDSLKL